MGRLRNGNAPHSPSGALVKLQQLEARTTRLEAFREDILRAMRNTFVMVEQRISNIEDVIEAMVELLGKDNVQAKVKELHIQKLETKAVADKVALDLALKDGRVVVAEAIGEKSVIVGSEVDKDGTPLHPSRVQLLFASISVDGMKERLLGKKVGDEVETVGGTKFTVQEIYDITMKAEVEAAAADSKPVEVPVEETPIPAEEAPDAAVEQALVEELAEAAKTDENPSN